MSKSHVDATHGVVIFLMAVHTGAQTFPLDGHTHDQMRDYSHGREHEPKRVEFYDLSYLIGKVPSKRECE
jgi:hypothetical protein